MLLQTFAGADGVNRLYCPEGLIAAASAKAGPVSGNPEIDSPALAQICAALECARAGQTVFGKFHAQDILLNALTKQLRLADYLHRFPEIRSTVVSDPLFIVAPFRTGSTFLHRLLSQDADNRTPRLWEVAYAPPPDPDLRGDARYLTEDRRIAVAQAALRGLHRQSPALGAMHPMGPQWAEECFGLLETTFLSHSFMFYADVPGYLDWLTGLGAAEWRAAYAIYAQQLRVLQWFHPGKRWVLKSPVHLWNLDILRDIFPTARFVFLHRDPPAVMAAFCGLLAAYRGLLSKSVDPMAIGRLASSHMRQALERGVAARTALDPSRCIDLCFDDLIRDPLPSAKTIYAGMGAEFTDDVAASMRQWVAPSQDTPRRSGPDLAAYGLDPDAIRMDFSDYAAFAADMR